MTGNDLGLILLTGIGATLFADLWTLLRERAFAVPMPNMALVGRWVAHMPHGRFLHDSIAASAPVRSERVVGWIVHYLIGSAFAFLVPMLFGFEWLRHPTLAPALIVGIGTVVAPYFVMQPAMGAGIAASRTPRPSAARFHSLVMHATFGLGLYVAARLFALLSTGE